MESKGCSSKATTDRKTTEKNRRNQMKTLYTQLNSVIPNQNTKDQMMPLPDQLEMAINYIRKLEKKLERLKEKKENLMGNEKTSKRRKSSEVIGLKSPQIEMHCIGSAIEIVMISGMGRQSMFYKILRILHEEGAEVVNASFSVVDETIFHTILTEVGDSSHGHGVEIISKRLNKLVDESANGGN